MEAKMYNLLLVDDETEILTFLEKLCAEIHEFEKTIYKANSGKRVLTLLETTRVDFVVSDIRMPGMNGLELCEAIRGKGAPL
jgi:two-component system response regulator YesN